MPAACAFERMHHRSRAVLRSRALGPSTSTLHELLRMRKDDAVGADFYAIFIRCRFESLDYGFAAPIHAKRKVSFTMKMPTISAVGRKKRFGRRHIAAKSNVAMGILRELKMIGATHLQLDAEIIPKAHDEWRLAS